MKVSILILTYNEAANLPACLSTLGWCDDIVVLDSGSTDATLEIAAAHGARLMSRSFDTFADQRNYGLHEGGFRQDWVLHLDADELVTSEFVAALERLQPETAIDAYQVPSKMMFFDGWLKHAGMWPTYQVRLGHRDRLRFRQVGHGQREDLPPERVGMFPEPYLHYSFSHGLARWLQKHVKYAADEAAFLLELRAMPSPPKVEQAAADATARRRRVKALSARLPFWIRPFARFLYVYLVRQGFRDGQAGLVYALMMSVYEGMIAILAYERMVSGTEYLLRPGPASNDANSHSAVQRNVAPWKTDDI